MKSLGAEKCHLKEIDPCNATIFIGGLWGNISEHMLGLRFAPFGEIDYIIVLSGKGCGFCKFRERQAALWAIHALQGQASISTWS